MAFSEAFLEWEQKTQERGERSLILRQLTKRVGELPDRTRSQIETFSIAQLESLGEALLDFKSLAELEIWLSEHG